MENLDTYGGLLYIYNTQVLTQFDNNKKKIYTCEYQQNCSSVPRDGLKQGKIQKNFIRKIKLDKKIENNTPAESNPQHVARATRRTY